MSAPAGTYAEAFARYRAQGWDGTLPLPPGTKTPPPAGFTGYTGAYPSGADCAEWADHVPAYADTAQLAVRLPPDVVGLDVDAYDGRTGAETMREAVQRWGPLPDGPWSGSRDDGSRICWFRVPEGTALRTTVGFAELGLAGVEVVQHFHRYAIVWPSVHPQTGARYVWHGTDGPDRPPKPADLPELPEPWVDALAVESVAAVAVGSAGVRAFLDGLPHGEPCRAVDARLDGALTELERGGPAMTRPSRPRWPCSGSANRATGAPWPRWTRSAWDSRRWSSGTGRARTPRPTPSSAGWCSESAGSV